MSLLCSLRKLIAKRLVGIETTNYLKIFKMFSVAVKKSTLFRRISMVLAKIVSFFIGQLPARSITRPSASVMVRHPTVTIRFGANFAFSLM